MKKRLPPVSIETINAEESPRLSRYLQRNTIYQLKELRQVSHKEERKHKPELKQKSHTITEKFRSP